MSTICRDTNIRSALKSRQGGFMLNPFRMTPVLVPTVWESHGANVSLADGNRTILCGASPYGAARSNNTHSTGKFYAEFIQNADGSNNNMSFGICTAATNLEEKLGTIAGGLYQVWTGGGYRYYNGGGLYENGPSYNSTQVVGVAVDFPANIVRWYINGSNVKNGAAIGANTYYLYAPMYGTGKFYTMPVAPSYLPAGFSPW